MVNFYNKYAAGGYGYIISRESMYYVINNENYICNEIYEDKAIGDVLFKNNILVNTKNYADLKKEEFNIDNVIYQQKKYAVILFHKNIKKLYKWRWIEKCLHSILNQSYKNYDIFEINYGGSEYDLFDDIRTNNNLFF